MRIGIIGTRGIPNHYGGFEELAEHLSVFLAEKGHEVYVYTSHNHPFQEPNFKGVNILHTKDPENRMGTVGQFFYDLNCILDSRKRSFDVILQLGYTSSSIWSFLMPRKAKLITNMDGLEWKRAKYSKPVKRFLRMAEGLAANSSELLVADALGIKEHIKRRFGKKAHFIPYGAQIFGEFDQKLLDNYSLPKQYDLVVARMEPENNIEAILKAYQGREECLVMVGKTENAFAKKMMQTYASSNVKWIGGVYDKAALNALRYHSRLHFHGHSVGGTNPSLLEAMGCSSLVFAHDNTFNREVLQENALYFHDDKDIILQLDTKGFADNKAAFVKANLNRISELYNWPSVNTSYLKLMGGP